ncbi:MAG: N-acetyl sugar amidotransferase [Betaproteobacteria bacterium]|nr:N-acetyl sugar amidotransferase [Betaproteobacteria bacterium]
MKYCKRCLYPENHPLHLTFDDEGVCSGCRIHEEKDRLDWRERLKQLKHLVAGFRSRKRDIHDCVVPVGGARDSWFIVHTVKHVLGLHPLLVTYNKHYNTQLGIRNLAWLRTQLGCDILTQTVAPQTVKKITRETLRLRGSLYWHCLAGATSFPVQVAARFRIPLVIWGAHQGLDQVGMFSHTDEVEMTRKYRKEHDLMGLEAEDLVRLSEGRLTHDEVAPYTYPSDGEIAATGVRGLYLGNYLRWDTKAQHETMLDLYGYETALQQRTFDTYNDVDCFHYSGLHDYTKYLKWGYGKATDHAVREIRLKRLTREEGMELVARYKDIPPADLPMFLEWIGMSEAEFFSEIDRHRAPGIWEKSGDQWQLRDSILNHQGDEGVESARLASRGPCNFSVTPNRQATIPDDRYILIGRGWVDEK